MNLSTDENHGCPLMSYQVVGEAQGDEISLQDFSRDLNEGPKHAHVIKLERSNVPIKERESSFEIT
jgi:acylphosphatase